MEEQTGEREWMTAEERKIHQERQAAEWKRHWESLTPKEQAQQRRKWDEDWKLQQAERKTKDGAGFGREKRA